MELSCRRRTRFILHKNMTLPTLLLGLIIAALYGTVFHFLRGGGLGRLLLYIFLSLLGFWLGHFLAASRALSILKIGALQWGGATAGSFIFLLVGNWLSQIQKKGRP